MRILGIGVDIIQNKRIKSSIKNKSFVSRTFGNKEIYFSKNTSNKTNYFAKRFAAKEALAKSIGTGFRKNINFNDIYVKNNRLGKPKLLFNNKVKNIMVKTFKSKKFNVFLSLSDEKRYSIAYVIINKL